MPPISINALADLRGRSLEVLWYADARVYAGQGKPRSAVGVALRLGDGVGSRLVRYVPAAMMTFVRLGDVWLGGKRVGSVPLDQAVFNRLSVTDETTAIAPAGASSSIPGGAPSFDLAFDKFDAHRGHTKSWVVRVDIDESTSLVVPCMELFRFYFAASGSLAAQLLSGVNAADKLFVEWHLSAKTGIANITLGKDIHGFAAATVARIASGGPARRAVRDLVKSGVSAYSDRRPWYPRLGFPFVGLTDLTAEGVWLDHPEKRVFVVHRILQCTHPFPFRQLFYRLFDGTQGNTRSVGITQPAAASDAPKVPSNAPAPPDLTSSEARDAHKGTYEVPTGQTEFEAFPDLASKKLVKVTRPALRAAAARNSDEAPGETTEVAPVGSDGGELSGIEPVPEARHGHEREPGALTLLSQKILTAAGAGSRVRSPLGGSTPLRLLVPDPDSDDSEGLTPVWLMVACMDTGISQNSFEDQVLISYSDTNADGPGFSFRLMAIHHGGALTAGFCETVANDHVFAGAVHDPLYGHSLLEARSGQLDDVGDVIESLSQSVAVVLSTT